MAGKGAPKGNQYRKGKSGKRTPDVLAKFEEMGCDPLEGMMRIAKECEDGFEERLALIAETTDQIESAKLASAMLKDVALAGKMYSELAQYYAPKRKAIEVSGGLTVSLEEMLENLE